VQITGHSTNNINNLRLKETFASRHGAVENSPRLTARSGALSATTEA
jgi:hypothetical protein